MPTLEKREARDAGRPAKIDWTRVGSIAILRRRKVREVLKVGQLNIGYDRFAMGLCDWVKRPNTVLHSNSSRLPIANAVIDIQGHIARRSQVETRRAISDFVVDARGGTGRAAATFLDMAIDLRTLRDALRVKRRKVANRAPGRNRGP